MSYKAPTKASTTAPSGVQMPSSGKSISMGTDTLDREGIASQAVGIVNKRSGTSLPGGTPTAAPMTTGNPEIAPIQQPPTAEPGADTPQQGLTKALESGVAPPQDPGEARSAMQAFQPSEANSFYKPSATSKQIYNAKGEALSYDQYVAQGGVGKAGDAAFADVKMGLPNSAVIDQQLEQDPGYQALLQAKQEYNDVANQRTSLTQEYDKLSKKLGIDSINTELMNMKNVIEGTEDDLRTEVTKAGGFATESQVQALTMARNKQLVKNYNNLLETKQMAMETLNTMIGLTAQDRQYAQQVALQKFQIETQVIDYQQKMKQNAATELRSIADKYGYGAITSGDPWQDALTERTLGLPLGGLGQLESMKTLEQQRYEKQYERGVFESDRAYGRGVLEGDRSYGLQKDQFNRGAFESDRAFNQPNWQQGEDVDGDGSPDAFNPKTGKYQSSNSYSGMYGGRVSYDSPYGGADIDLKKGDPVLSPVNGEVIFAGPNGGYGNHIKIRDDNGNEIWLAHLDSGNVRVGDRVSARQQVGIGGNTGNVIPGKGGDGSHLDIRVVRNGKEMSMQDSIRYVDEQWKNSTPQKQGDYGKGLQFVKDNPGASRQEIEAGIRQNLPKLEESEVTSLLGQRKITRDEVKSAATQKQAQDSLKETYSTDELFKLAKEHGYASFWTGKETDINRFLESAKARELYIDIIYNQYKSSGMAQ